MAGFSSIPNKALKDKRLTHLDRCVLMALALRTNSGGYCFPAYNKIAEDAFCSRRTAIYAVKKLVEYGYLLKQKRTIAGSAEQTSNGYFINYNPEE